MKYTWVVILLMMGLISACSNPKKNVPQTDSVQSVKVAHDEIATGGNMVKSEAPDAVAKIVQGYALPKFDDGQAQSPIDIITDSTVRDNNQFISIKFKTGITAIENLGHTIQLDFREGSTTITGGKTYSTKQFHFHTPSEHMIDGITYPMEMHIVNVLKDSDEKKNPQFLVIALLFKMGRENTFIKEFLKAIPGEEGKDTLPSGTVRFEDLFLTIPKKEEAGFYFYHGSFTTPPYTESVLWIVKKYILEASPEQITAIEKKEGDNARHVRALYARKVYSNK
jgi:carbonic anhydrase